MEKLVRLLPRLPGKGRLARFLLASRLNDRDVDIRTRSGLIIRAPSLREPIAFHLLCNGTYEPETIDAILQQLRHGGTFVDVGANIGAIALEIAMRRPDAHIIAIEPSPDVLPYLEHNVTRNGLANVRIANVAASDHDGDIDFYLPPAEQFGMASTAPQFGVEPVRVRAQTLDSILASVGIAKVSVIKIDAEGAELDVLVGARRMLAGPDAPAVIFEFVDWAEERLHERGAAQRALLEMGYTLALMDRPKSPLRQPVLTGGAMLLATRPPAA